MKRTTLFTILLLLAVLIAPNSTVYSQTRDSSIVTIDETIGFLLNQNQEAKNVIAAQEKRIADLETELEVEKENSASIGKSYESAISEISSLKTSNAALARAVAVNEDTIAKLLADNAKQREKAKKAARAKWKAIAVAAGVIVLKIVLP